MRFFKFFGIIFLILGTLGFLHTFFYPPGIEKEQSLKKDLHEIIINSEVVEEKFFRKGKHVWLHATLKPVNIIDFEVFFLDNMIRKGWTINRKWAGGAVLQKEGTILEVNYNKKTLFEKESLIEIDIKPEDLKDIF